MPIYTVRNNITRMNCDAVVNAANPKLQCDGRGVDTAIHRAAGPGLDEECWRLGGCRPGRAKITGGHALPCKYVIHTVGPYWLMVPPRKEEILSSCYREALEKLKPAKQIKRELVLLALSSQEARTPETTKSLDDMLKQMDESFSQMLLRKLMKAG